MCIFIVVKVKTKNLFIIPLLTNFVRFSQRAANQTPTMCETLEKIIQN